MGGSGGPTPCPAQAMNRRLVVRDEAEADIQEAALWYEEQRADLGLEFVAEVRAAIQRAVAWPLAHHLMLRRHQVRRILTKRFPYRIFYIVRDDAVIVFAVVHAARHNREWKRRA